MTSTYPSVSASNGTASSFAGIVAALNQLRVQNGETSKSYPSSYQGIIQAIVDLQKWGTADNGEYPPGWEIITDDEGNVIGGNFAPPPKNGDLWFDTRQGRLFVWIDDGFYQTNGADGLPTVSDSVPAQEVTGGLWFNTLNNGLYIYDGTGWEQITNPTTSFSTAGLILSNPTTDTFNSPGDTLPDAAAVTTQEDYNQFIFKALTALEGAVEGIDEAKPLPVGPNTPASGAEGDQFYNTAKETLFIYSGGAWHSAGGPDPDISNYPVIGALQQANIDAAVLREQIQNRITTLEGLPRKTYGLRSSGSDIILTDSTNNEDRIPFAGAGGITVSKSGDNMLVDGSSLASSIATIQNDYLKAADKTELTEVDSQQQSSINALTAATNTNTANIGTIFNAIDQLPTAAQLGERLSAAGGTLSGNLLMDGHRISGAGNPVDDGDVTNLGYEDDREARMRNDLVSKVGTTLQSIAFNNNDAAKASLDFSAQPVNGRNAFKFQTYTGGNPHYVTFGTHDRPQEYSWKYDGDEAFNWVRNGTRVFAIEGENVYARDFILANLTETATGTAYTNQINIRDVITELQQSSSSVTTQLQSLTNEVAALQGLQIVPLTVDSTQDASAVVALTGSLNTLSSTLNTQMTDLETSVDTEVAALESQIVDLESQIATLQEDVRTLASDKNIFYSDEAPTENLSNGDLWFDSGALRLNVYHYGAWVFPDRVEDQQLKQDLFEAVQESTDFQTLKIKLMAALI